MNKLLCCLLFLLISVPALGMHPVMKRKALPLGRPDASKFEAFRDLNFKYIKAVESGTIRDVSKCLEEGANVNALNRFGRPALLLAVLRKKGNAGIVCELLNSGAAVNATTSDRKTALMFVAQNGNSKLAMVLLGRKNINIDAQDSQRMTALMYAVQHKNYDIVRMLLEHKADVNLINNLGQAALMIAVESGNIDIVAELVCMGKAPVNLPNRDGITPLMRAAEKGYADVVQWLISNGVDINASRSPRVFETPLMRAAKTGDIEMARLLISKGAVIDISDSTGWTALMSSLDSGNIEMMQLLLEHGADVNAIGSGRTVLMWAVQDRKIDFIRLLLERGVEVSAAATDGTTALEIARRNGDSEMIELLQRYEIGAFLAGLKMNDQMDVER